MGDQLDFVTAGLNGREIDEFVAALLAAGVTRVVDVRERPAARFRPETSKSNLARRLAEHGISYENDKALGIPAAIRKPFLASGDREGLLAWYDEHVTGPLSTKELRALMNHNDSGITAFVCQEEDATQCHRSRLAVALTRVGLAGEDV